MNKSKMIFSWPIEIRRGRSIGYVWPMPAAMNERQRIYQRYQKQALFEIRNARSGEAKELTKRIGMAKLSVIELKCILALWHSKKYTWAQIARIFLYTDI